MVVLLLGVDGGLGQVVVPGLAPPLGVLTPVWRQALVLAVCAAGLLGEDLPVRRASQTRVLRVRGRLANWPLPVAATSRLVVGPGRAVVQVELLEERVYLLVVHPGGGVECAVFKFECLID